ncbi:SlyX family protein [Palleronia sp. LCG004]|uniref:SlyX family protein n=1 Tax=Palleronia sp. LCG004 TaxID=3079304 RepID=UPI0029424514|nr:SlyX family protein [Palleronia sp. LCG004]WOI55510.1 SlyX family protein [Palleronia sp. LCG004]
MDLSRIEERIAHLIRANDDLSEIVRDQADRIELLERRVHMLMEREARRDADDGGSIPFGDERPPHW